MEEIAAGTSQLQSKDPGPSATDTEAATHPDAGILSGAPILPENRSYLY